MKYLKKYHYLIYPILYLFFFGILALFEIENQFLKFGLPAILSVLLSPKYSTIDTQSGETTIVKWIFFEKTFVE